MESSVTINIIGGCMLGQRVLGISNLFFRKFSARLLQEKNIRSTVKLHSHNDFESLPEKAASIDAEPNQYQMVILQLRPGLIFRRCNLLVPIRGKGKFRFALNPYITNGKAVASSAPVLTLQENDADLPVATSTISKIIATANALAGMAVGFDKKGARQIIDFILRTAAICRQKEIKFLVIGCVNSCNNKLLRLQYSSVNNRLKKAMEANSIPYLDLFHLMEDKRKAGINLYLEDGYHLNEKGHALIAENLYEQTAADVEACMHM